MIEPASSILSSLKHLHALDKYFITSTAGWISKASLPGAIQLTSGLPLPAGNFMIIYVVFLLFHKKYIWRKQNIAVILNHWSPLW